MAVVYRYAVIAVRGFLNRSPVEKSVRVKGEGCILQLLAGDAVCSVRIRAGTGFRSHDVVEHGNVVRT